VVIAGIWFCTFVHGGLHFGEQPADQGVEMFAQLARLGRFEGFRIPNANAE
jgi:hypothetical protein